MNTSWSVTQKQKLIELNADPHLLNEVFVDMKARDQAFQKIEKGLVKKNKDHLTELKNSVYRPMIFKIEGELIDRLVKEGFVQVTTPIILAKKMLEKMTITSEHPLNKQVFWLDKNKCLRHMLAPNLYYVLRDLERVWKKPVRIFEIGPCFRKESQGAYHLNEFTMLNLVELGVPEGQQDERLRELGAILMNEIGIKDYKFVMEASEVYGTTIDVVSRIRGYRNIRRIGRSLSYLDGSRLNI